MARHTIDVETIRNLSWSNALAGSVGGDSHKRLEIHGEAGRMLLPQYRVISHDEIKYDGVSLLEAIAVYNDAP